MEEKKPVEDIDRARNHLMLSSVGVVLYYGGQVNFAQSVDLEVAGLRIDNPSILPVVLVVFWLYFWQRFTSLSTAAYRDDLGALLTGHVNVSEFVRRVIRPVRYGITDEPKIETRGWMGDLPRAALGPSHVIYMRKPFARVFEFSYLVVADRKLSHF